MAPTLNACDPVESIWKVVVEGVKPVTNRVALLSSIVKVLESDNWIVWVSLVILRQSHRFLQYILQSADCTND